MFESVVASAFLIGILSALSLPLGTLTSFFWRPEDRAIAAMMAFGGGAGNLFMTAAPPSMFALL